MSKVFTRGPARPHAGKARHRALSPTRWVHKVRRLIAQGKLPAETLILPPGPGRG